MLGGGGTISIITTITVIDNHSSHLDASVPARPRALGPPGSVISATEEIK